MNLVDLYQDFDIKAYVNFFEIMSPFDDRLGILSSFGDGPGCVLDMSREESGQVEGGAYQFGRETLVEARTHAGCGQDMVEANVCLSERLKAWRWSRG